MGSWEKIQKDIKKNIKEGLAIVKEGGIIVSQKTRLVAKRVEKLTEGGKRKYKIFTLKMKVQDEFARLGGKVYDIGIKRKNPVSNKGVSAIISKISKLEAQISGLEKKRKKRAVKSGSRRARRKTSKTSFKKKVV